MKTFKGFLMGVGLVIGLGAVVFAQTTLKLGSTVGIEAGEFSSNWRAGIGFGSGLAVSTSVSLKGAEFSGKTTRLDINLSRYSLNVVGGFNQKGLKQATFKSGWRISDMLNMIANGNLTRDGLQKATMSVKESSTGYNLSLNTFWAENKFKDFSVGAKRNLNQYALNMLFSDLATENPYLDATITTLFPQTNFSWNFHMDPTGIHEQTFGAYYHINDIRTSTMVTFGEDTFEGGQLKLQLNRDMLQVENVAYFDLHFITKNVFKFKFNNRMASAKGAFTFGRKGVLDGIVEAQTDLTEGVDVTAKVEMAEYGFEKATLGTETILGENINTRVSLVFVDKGFTNGSVRFSYPWRNYNIASVTGFDLEGFRSQSVSVDTSFNL